MTPAQFGRVEELFHQALERPAAERARFLRDNESDADIVAAAERLLACDDDAAPDPVSECLTQVAREVPLRSIGPYRLLRELGVGGMGAVFLAERDVAGRVQQVAVKLLHGIGTAHNKRRMERERAMLAGLNHPNIARHIDGGESAEGQPYLVMDYVEGPLLPQYLAEAKPSLPQRLKLYLSLCDAVQHAHQRLVLHRDIKPSNVAVRADGAPVLLDFGVGALLEEGDNPTHPPTRAFTPGYSAPEQYRGQTETMATDVFGLGALLFDLLTGQRLSTLYRGDATVPAPSASVADPSLRHLLRGDLDRIVRKATATDPELRYRTVAALMDDIQRYLQGLPISAAPDRLWYRVGKFVRRNRVAVAASAMLAVAGTLAVWQLNNERQRALAAERAAETEAANAKASRDFLASVLAETSPEAVRGQPITIATLLTNAAARLQTDRSQSERTRLVAWLTIAEVYADINDPQPGLAAIDAAIALSPRKPQPQDLELRARALHVRGNLLLQLERLPEARAALDQAIALRERQGAPAPTLARLYSDYGSVVLHTSDFAAAQRYQQRALQRLDASGQHEPELRMEIELGLARSLYYQNKIEDAARHLGIAETIERERPARDGLAAYQLRRIAMMVRYSQHRYPQALANAEQALRLAYRVYGENSRLTADMELYTALLLDDVGRSRAALAHYQRSQAIARALKLDDAVLARDDVRMAAAYANLGDHARAQALTDSALARMPDAPAYTMYRIIAYYTRGLSLSAQGRYPQARADFQRSLELARGYKEDVFYGPAFVQLRHAQGLVEAHRFEEAAAALEDAEPVLQYRELEPKSVIVLRSLQAEVALSRGELIAATQRIDEALQLAQRHYLAGTLPIATVELAAARIALRRGDAVRAGELLNRAEPLLRRELRAPAPALADAARLRQELERGSGSGPGHDSRHDSGHDAGRESRRDARQDAAPARAAPAPRGAGG
ncbi:protein kinase domain-containing protein [Lysobacter enzymogenes]|uniref:protein kinase domain-containing protein n=1 Tax=Lysobacter enzymogenes TaxID=69 RepID=UPI001AFCA22C|nr:protein kinase [Lysobacter enzymogenes]QQP99565.1 protein kinase [Lysobacter enzymogenes]